MWRKCWTGLVPVFAYRRAYHRENNGKAVIVNINMDLAAQYQIVAVDQRIDKSLENASLAVIRHFNAGVSGFLPAGFHIPLDKADTLIE